MIRAALPNFLRAALILKKIAAGREGNDHADRLTKTANDSE